MKILIKILPLPVLLLWLWSCARQPAADAADYAWPDTLRVATLYSPTSYFIYRDQKMGYDYSLLESLVKEKNLALDLKVATSLEDALTMLDSGWVDLVAYEVPRTSEYRDRAVACGPRSMAAQVLVQPRGSRSQPAIKDVTELVGREVYVEAPSKYLQRINNLNSELGGGIIVHTVDSDTLITEDLINMVSRGEIPLTVVDSDIARINKTYFPNLDISLALSFEQESAWAVAPDRKWLADSIDAWLADSTPRDENATLLKRYFELSKNSPKGYTVDFSKGKVSPFDDILRRESEKIGWDWRMLAALCFVESRFDPNVVSWAGARGVMQIMPATARAYGTDPETMVDPQVSVSVAGKVLTSLDKSLASKVPDPQERRKFVIAAYNSGLAHIYDAITIARLTGRNPQVWSGNVEEALLLKANPEYFNHPEVKYGYFRGRQTTAYVLEVLDFYDRCIAKIKQ